MIPSTSWTDEDWRVYMDTLPFDKITTKNPPLKTLKSVLPSPDTVPDDPHPVAALDASHPEDILLQPENMAVFKCAYLPHSLDTWGCAPKEEEDVWPAYGYTHPGVRCRNVGAACTVIVRIQAVDHSPWSSIVLDPCWHCEVKGQACSVAKSALFKGGEYHPAQAPRPRREPKRRRMEVYNVCKEVWLRLTLDRPVDHPAASNQTKRIDLLPICHLSLKAARSLVRRALQTRLSHYVPLSPTFTSLSTFCRPLCTISWIDQALNAPLPLTRSSRIGDGPILGRIWYVILQKRGRK
ncbi:hypothetical protein BD324DRAFT_640162 [Kockovaella imperatae]|uniref:Uncharacterized protein n=1 Tax=Kockovaella imperatae TaxID=4999 RepID=A0A1Y1U5L5_9TREE|nr:hypothetical protein BD324DRAFT_640162 [Kockovaella imperatae]ORX33318.1 hypothetical protein BD324DRAFT_640162 [Kockovaella imperatae]